MRHQTLQRKDKRWHDKKIVEYQFELGQYVLLYNEIPKLGYPIEEGVNWVLKTSKKKAQI